MGIEYPAIERVVFVGFERIGDIRLKRVERFADSGMGEEIPLTIASGMMIAAIGAK